MGAGEVGGWKERGGKERTLLCSSILLKTSRKASKRMNRQQPFRASVSLCKLIQLTKVFPIPRGT